MTSRERTAFFAAPFIAALVWYVLTLANLAVVNGRIRLGPDVLAMAIGALTWGLLTAAAATMFVAIPLHRIVARTIGVSLAAAIAGGAIVGLLLGALAWIFELSLSLTFSPLHAVVIGVVTAGAWWRLAGRPQRASGS